jgi:hypothetical protein
MSARLLLVLALSLTSSFAEAQPSGPPDKAWPDGSRYWGALRFDVPQGLGYLSGRDGRSYQGEFTDGKFNGRGRLATPARDVYEGEFVDGVFSGKGRFIGNDGARYEGEFKQWLFDGAGRLKLPNGDEYQGGFARGLYEGEGTLKYARPPPGTRTEVSGTWHQGRLEDAGERTRASQNLEIALYNQRALLDAALAALAPPEKGRINLYLLAVAGDGSQEVFRREVEFVRGEFDRGFGTRGRSIALINSRSTVASAPMATLTSLRESLQAIGARMNREQDILFLFLTSHGTREHELRLNQSAMTLSGLQPRELARMLQESGIRWKVVLVSACYSGGFVEPLKGEGTLVITAARGDRVSFGCADEAELTDFGRAYFKQALPAAKSFQDAFARAQKLVEEWETQAKQERSLPQIAGARPIEEQLEKWWKQPRQ